MRIEAHDIHRDMPQRYPLLLVDRVTELCAGQRVKAQKAVSLNDYFYNSLPEQPQQNDFAYPAALLIEALAQAAGLLLRETWLQLRSREHLVMFGSFAGISIHASAFPGDVLDMEARLDAVHEDVAVISGHIECDGRMLMEAKAISAALRATSTLG